MGNNIKILLNNDSELDYLSPESLGIKFNRIVDDLTDPTKTFGDFSYTFSIPKTKNNNHIFEYGYVKGRTSIFIGKSFDCKVYNNTILILSGIIELVEIGDDNYLCRLYSQFTQLADILKDRNLQDMTYLDTINWNFEFTIVEHLNVAPVSSQIEFPFIFYQTPFMSGATSTVVTTPSQNYNEACLGYYYNYINSSLPFGRRNPLYQSSLPPAIYLYEIMNGIFEDAGWSWNSSFFNKVDIKKIVIPFTGKGQDFTGAVITGTTNTLNLNKLLPSLNQAQFLKTILNTFNLYIIIDNFQKSITIESYDTMFSDNSNPYPINLYETKKSKIEFQNRLILDKDDLNEYPLGFNRIMDYSRITNTNPSYNLNTCIDIRLTLGLPRLNTSYKKDAWSNMWNKTTGNQDIPLGISPVNYYPYCSISEENINGSVSSDNLYTVGIPIISKQIPSDNNGKPFADDIDTNYVQGNDPSNIDYDGGIKLLYYYGSAKYDADVQGGTEYRNWLYFLIATGGTVTVPTFARCKMGLASPFKLLNTAKFNEIISNPNNFITVDERLTEKGAELHSLLLTFMGNGTLDDSHTPTEFSLTLGDNSVFDNIYTVLHQTKYNDYLNNFILSGKMRMSELDWENMQINRCLIFDKELYRLVSIKDYDPIGRIASVELLKKN